MKPKYKRVILKVSGEALAGDNHFGINEAMLKKVALQIKEPEEGRQKREERRPRPFGGEARARPRRKGQHGGAQEREPRKTRRRDDGKAVFRSSAFHGFFLLSRVQVRAGIAAVDDDLAAVPAKPSLHG